jgi:hypothetical protein
MFAMNKETMMMVAIAIALIATFYLYKEMQKSKLEIQRLSDVPVSVPVPVSIPVQTPKSIIKKERVSLPTVTIVADEIED